MDEESNRELAHYDDFHVTPHPTPTPTTPIFSPLQSPESNTRKQVHTSVKISKKKVFNIRESETKLCLFPPFSSYERPNKTKQKIDLCAPASYPPLPPSVHAPPPPPPLLRPIQILSDLTLWTRSNRMQF